MRLCSRLRELATIESPFTDSSDFQELFRMTTLYKIFIDNKRCIRKRTKKKVALALKNFCINNCKTLVFSPIFLSLHHNL